MLIFFLHASSEKDYDPSNDGLTLRINVNGPVTQEGVDSSGNKKSYLHIFVESAISIDPYAFLDCVNAIDISICDSVTSIGEGCFKNCHSLQTFSFPRQTTVINDYMFIYCYNLITVNISANINSISGTFAFCRCNSLRYFYVHQDNQFFSSDSTNHFLLTRSGGNLICGYSNNTVHIPSYITTLKTFCFNAIEIIRSVTFDSNSQLTTIEDTALYQIFLTEPLILPDGLLKLGNFMSGGQCLEISIPNSLNECPYNVFAGASMLSKVTLRGGNNNALHEIAGTIYTARLDAICFVPINILNLTIPDTVESIDTATITKTSILEKVIVSDSHPKLSSCNGILYDKAGINLLASPFNLKVAKIRSECQYIKESSFQGTKVVRVEFIGTSSLTHILQSAFMGCRSLAYFEFPPKLIALYGSCFCLSNLNMDVVLHSNLGIIGYDVFRISNISSIDMTACTKINTIPFQMFADCYCLQSVKFPSSITRLNEKCFTNCLQLKQITIPSTISNIEFTSFQGCSSLCTIIFDEVSQLTAFTISVFQNCNLTSISIPKNVQTLMSNCLADNPFLSSITFPESNLSTIMPNAFSGCSSLVYLNLPSTVTSISIGGLSSMTSCTELTIDSPNYKSIRNVIYNKDLTVLICCAGGVQSVRVADVSDSSPGVNQIETQAFFGCSSLQTITFPDSCTIDSILESTFYGCVQLQKIEIPGSVREVCTLAFKGCMSLSDVLFLSPSSLEVLGTSSFVGCTSLLSVTFEATPKIRRDNIGSSFREIGNNAFSGCDKLERFDFKQTLTKIGDSAFEGCSSLSDVTLFDGLQEIGTRAFAGCRSIMEVKFPSSIHSIGKDAFSECSSLYYIRFCGQFLFDSVLFNGVKVDFAYVPQNYTQSSIGGLTAIRILDVHCNAPTGAFTRCGGLPKFDTLYLASLFDNEVHEGG